MRQASLKLKSYAGNVNIIDNGNLQKRILNMMLWMLGILALSYVFFLGNIVFNIVERKTLEVYAHTLSNDVGNLELEYLSLSQKVDLNLAYSLGFKEIKTKFATRKTLGSISIAENEI
ncbi:hypothetical protein CO033_00470 [Candidatus Nomurabacteria bacterium CG_4_9_14_0_2_um_filter_32_10]|uniref:Cell division protein FtsL n=3 Tax=Candidatus Nomuraibacteriota TaxID=1752729 RepID=A0A2H0CHI2_9BACT|nr:MAG: hypothetical protein COW91_00455 [Candidatus Nomurabacteria bacterium CG22_combo_CG10-13_8_21_14_all_32_8]PIZ85307.1 MAG: hypothetical protein COX94_03015 [Candidatus Nomurabacteria bacterium CG_4_10_14_0_2_um_filter_33_9]PJC49634.1 MAG: hypothetical protein CO033_00470 [Candidatus Nomurabacteria bacterium CG_4_9_14_0_2_um_filter_32_10]